MGSTVGTARTNVNTRMLTLVVFVLVVSTLYGGSWYEMILALATACAALLAILVDSVDDVVLVHSGNI